MQAQGERRRRRDPRARRHRVTGRAGPAAPGGRRGSRWSWRTSSTRTRPWARWSTRTRARTRRPRRAPRSSCSCRRARPTGRCPMWWAARSPRRPTCSARPASRSTRRRRPSDTVEEGRVIRTDPPADTVRPKGDAITVVVSSGPAEVNVISVVGLTRDEREELAGVGRLRGRGGGLRPGCTDLGWTARIPRATRARRRVPRSRSCSSARTRPSTAGASNTVEEGRVIRTDPPADTVRPKGDAITVVVSSGPAEVNVISVVGLTRQEREELAGVGGLRGRGGGVRSCLHGPAGGQPEPRRQHERTARFDGHDRARLRGPRRRRRGRRGRLAVVPIHVCHTGLLEAWGC